MDDCTHDARDHKNDVKRGRKPELQQRMSTYVLTFIAYFCNNNTHHSFINMVLFQ